MGDYFWLAIACFAFVSTHFLMSHPMRAELVRIFRLNGFLLLYSAVSLAIFWWMVVAFQAAPRSANIWPVNSGLWIASTVITLFAAVLFVGSLFRNPSLPSPGAEKYAVQDPSGVFRVTRHPMMWGIALWGIAHIMVAPHIASLIFVGSLIFLAVVGAKAQEIKKARLIGVSWDSWLRKTSFGPNPAAFGRAGFGAWFFGIALWLGATWLHAKLNAPTAGIWTWLPAL